MTYHSFYWEDVEEGQDLPSITYELSLLRLVAMVRASGVYDYVHFDRDYAQAVGARDAFIANHHAAGLFGRLMTDWAGPEADIRSLSFRMNTQSCANDILTITGKVGRKYIGRDGEYLVDLSDLNIAHPQAAAAVQASATMALPSRAGGPVKPRSAATKPERPAPDHDMPEFARPMIGAFIEGVQEPAWPLSEVEIHLWCECLEDWNPLYWDKAYASKSLYGGLIAPRTGFFLGTHSGSELGVGYGKPGNQVPDAVKQGLTGFSLFQELRMAYVDQVTPLSPPGCPEIAVVRVDTEYFAPLRLGDSTRSRQEVLNCSPKKRTKLGEGYFVSWISSVYNQREELVKTVALTLFHYHA